MEMDEIQDSHLLNIIRLLGRKYLKILDEAYSAMSCMQGEMALMSVESGMDSDLENNITRSDMFRAEAKRRGLKSNG
jgi:hypothetical protein